MPNALTGDFDVVAQFAVPAVNRLLAAMHRVERFPHSLSIRIDDPPPSPWDVVRPTMVGLVDSMGSAVPDQDQIRPFPIGLAHGGRVWSMLDAIVNVDPDRTIDPHIEPSDIQGRAQIQISPPLMEIPDGAGTNITARMNILARFFPDAGTPPLAEFIRGEIAITAPVTQANSQVGGVVDVDIRSNDVTVGFTTHWSSTPLSVQDTAGINKMVANALKTSFLPSNSRLPSNIAHAQFKTIRQGPGAVALMLNFAGAAGNPGSHSNAFLSGNDGFAFGVGADFVRQAFQPTLDRILSEPVDPVRFRISSLVYTWRVRYDITLSSATVNLESGKIVLVISGYARTDTSWLPNFNFTVRQDFTLQPDGGTANLVTGDISLDTSSWIADRFRGGAIASMRAIRDRAMAESDANGTVRRVLSAEVNLGAFMDSLLRPATTTPVVEPRIFSLGYTSADITPAGVVLHGDLSVTPWPAPRVEFETVPHNETGTPGGLGGMPRGPDYSALKTWIPGGRIESYEWRRQGQANPGNIDTDRFVRLGGPAIVLDEALLGPIDSSLLCVVVRGSRLSASGAVLPEPVTGVFCGSGIPPRGGRIGGLAPNFVFEHARGSSITLRKLSGTRVKLVFVSGASAANVDALRGDAGTPDGKRPIVLVISDGEPGDNERREAREGLSAIVIPDRGRRIARAYGVTEWPTTVSIDENGVVTRIAQGSSTDELATAQRSGS